MQNRPVDKKIQQEVQASMSSVVDFMYKAAEELVETKAKILMAKEGVSHQEAQRRAIEGLEAGVAQLAAKKTAPVHEAKQKQAATSSLETPKAKR